MSSLPRVAPTRRTVLRSAAWSTAAVTVVVATPNMAAATPGATPSGTGAILTTSYRVGKDLYPKASLAAGAQPIGVVTATVSINVDTIKTITTPAGWSRTGLTNTTATFQLATGVPAGKSATFEPHINMGSNPDSVVRVGIVFAWPTSGSWSDFIDLKK